MCRWRSLGGVQNLPGLSKILQTQVPDWVYSLSPSDRGSHRVSQLTSALTIHPLTKRPRDILTHTTIHSPRDPPAWRFTHPYDVPKYYFILPLFEMNMLSHATYRPHPLTWNVKRHPICYSIKCECFTTPPGLTWGGIQRQMLKHGLICDWAVFSKSRIRAVFENRFFPGNIPIPKTFSFNHSSICDWLKPGIPVFLVL